MEVISDEKYRELLREHPDLERLPMLAVATKKPPNKRKGRVVVCGNHSTKQLQPGEPDPSVGGIYTVALSDASSTWHLSATFKWLLWTSRGLFSKPLVEV